MKAESSLVVWCEEKKKRKKEDDENVFFKALGKKFFVNIKKLFMTNLLSYRLHEKVIICYIIILYY